MKKEEWEKIRIENEREEEKLGKEKMSLNEVFGRLRGAAEWLFDKLEINDREDQPKIDELEKLLNQNSMVRYTVIKMVSKMLGGKYTPESALRILYNIFGGDGPDEGMWELSKSEYEDKSKLTLRVHIQLLYLSSLHKKEGESPWKEAVKRMIESLRESWYFERESREEIRDELRNIFSVYQYNTI